MVSDLASAGVSLLPTTPTFAGHQTFALRGGWLKKGLDALQDDAQIFSRPDALVTLGVGKNMVAAIRHWLLATQMAALEGRALQPTPLGVALLRNDGYDPYLEKPSSLWLLHWKLCGPGSEVFTFAWTFNLWREWNWSRENLGAALQEAAISACAKAPSGETLERDIGVLLQTYAPSDNGQNSEDGLDSPLRELGLLRAATGTYRFSVGPKPSLSPQLFALALAHFWQWKFPRAQTLPAREATYAEGSPSVVFKLDEDATLCYLDALEDATQGALHFEDTPLVRQIVKTQAFDFDLLLARAFA